VKRRINRGIGTARGAVGIGSAPKKRPGLLTRLVGRKPRHHGVFNNKIRSTAVRLKYPTRNRGALFSTFIKEGRITEQTAISAQQEWLMDNYGMGRHKAKEKAARQVANWKKKYP